MRRDDNYWVDYTCWAHDDGWSGLTHLNQGAAPPLLASAAPSGPGGTASRPLRTVDQDGREAGHLGRSERSPSDGTIQYGTARHSTDADLPWDGTVATSNDGLRPPSLLVYH